VPHKYLKPAFNREWVDENSTDCHKMAKFLAEQFKHTLPAAWTPLDGHRHAIHDAHKCVLEQLEAALHRYKDPRNNEISAADHTEMQSVCLEPWQGKLYRSPHRGVRLLVLGESQYNGCPTHRSLRRAQSI